MKKIILLAGILVIGTISANTIIPKYENGKKSEEKKEVVSKNKYKTTLKTKAAKKRECATVTVTCTSAYTCQDWTANQWIDWAQQIQNNYCMYNSPFTP
ncbi:hypothetical protein J3D55_002893 [Chryseobacterium ginsenosidimutans]|uniref:hypothetical protein n=1 Tax=Chryseobacterium ginsenosidimutans TaxID=687846 RepID=UPI002166E64F|nr:hypothetical protein [Chryseobacterium ginsenosidimutans]MCS3869977.1 hypothetical protein [Chryseobacterium ginsenosidimutans]